MGEHATNDSQARKEGPTYTEVMRSLYSSYLGDDFMAGVDRLQDNYPQLRPVVLVSSLFSVGPLFWFGACVAGIFTVNLVAGVFVMQCHRVLTAVPQYESASSALYAAFESHSQTVLMTFYDRVLGCREETEEPATKHNSDVDEGKPRV